MINLNIIKNLYEYFNEKNEKTKRILLEPLTTMFRISSLTFMEKNTKIRITKNKIILQEPNLLQGFERWYYGDKKTDVHNLCSPLKYFIIWKKDDYDNDDLKYLIENTIKGLEIIKKMYSENDLVQQVIHHYIIMLKNPQDIYDEEKDRSMNLFYNKIKDLWNQKDISIAVDLMKKINNPDSEYQKKYFKKSLYSFLDGKDYYVYKLLNNIASGKEFN